MRVEERALRTGDRLIRRTPNTILNYTISTSRWPSTVPCNVRYAAVGNPSHQVVLGGRNRTTAGVALDYDEVNLSSPTG
jgi:hypothetical protein